MGFIGFRDVGSIRSGIVGFVVAIGFIGLSGSYVLWSKQSGLGF